MKFETLWSDAETARLKDLASKNPAPTYRVIAQLLGKTRNSVIGKAHRMGIYSAIGSGVRTDLPAKNRAAYRKLSSDRASVRKVRLLPIPDLQHAANKNLADTAPIPLKDAAGANLTIMTVSNRGCRWPYGSIEVGDFHYCGHPSVKDKSWCEFHKERVFHPTKLASERVAAR